MHHLPSLTRGLRSFTALAAVGIAALLLLLVVDEQPGINAVVIGLAVAALVALGSLDASAVVGVRLRTPEPPAEERRLRGGFRRQHRPDTPGRPMPRAPGSVA